MSRPRIRTVKPEAWHDEKVGRLSRDARLLFIVLITFADDDGRFRALPSAILGHGYPYDSDAGRKIDKWLAELAAESLIELYTVESLPYGRFPQWARHQRVNRATPSQLPAPSVNGHRPLTEKSLRVA